MVRLLIGLALMPSSALTLAAAAKALALLASRSSAAFPFVAGLLLATAAWIFLRYCSVSDAGPVGWAGALARRTYIFGHELTHALAAWSVGGKVLGFKVGETAGHVDLLALERFHSAGALLPADLHRLRHRRLSRARLDQSAVVEQPAFPDPRRLDLGISRAQDVRGALGPHSAGLGPSRRSGLLLGLDRLGQRPGRAAAAQGFVSRRRLLARRPARRGGAQRGLLALAVAFPEALDDGLRGPAQAPMT